MEKIILDTNFLVAPFQLSFDVFDEIEQRYPYAGICTLEDALEESKSIEGGKYKELVPKMIEKQEVEVIETEGEGSVDDLLVDISDNYLVATNDKELKERIKHRGNPVLIIRSRDHLEVENASQSL